MRMLALLCLAACGAGSADGPSPSDAPTVDAPPGCVVGITYEVVPPFAGATTVVRAVANVQNSPGQHTYQWFLSFNGGPNQTPPSASVDGSQVEFPATLAGTYRVRFRIEDPNCSEAEEPIQVSEQGVGTSLFRVHVVAPASSERPPFDKIVTVLNQATSLLDDIQLAPGTLASGSVELGGIPVAAYLKFIPAVGSDAVVETYSDGSGEYAATLRSESHSVLVIPTSPTISPQLASWSPGQTTISLQQGTALTGTVLNPQGNPLANATVQLTIDGVPSTVGTTDAAGVFGLLAPSTMGKVRFEVTPPATTGLPKLVAEAAQYSLNSAISIAYASSLATTRDLNSTTIQRGGALPNATVTIVGTFDTAGTISTGTPLTAKGEARFTAVTNGSGALPTLRVPASPLTAVIFPAGTTGDHAVTPIDLTTSVPGSINAAARITKTTQLQDFGGTGRQGIVLDAVPKDALALAGAPTIHRVAGAGGNLTIDLAPNALYDIRLSDPNGNRGARELVEDRTTANLAAVNKLKKATKATATVIGAAPISGAIVQFLCTDCTGIERSRPIAEGITGIDGSFTLAVPDPD